MKTAKVVRCEIKSPGYARVTIPIEFSRKLGLDKNTFFIIIFDEEANQLILKPVKIKEVIKV